MMRFLRPSRWHNASKGSSVRQSLVFSSAQQYTDFLISFPTILILSRLLTPTQIGVYSVAITFVNMVHMLRDLGTSDYLVQVRDLTDDIARSAYTINLIFAWVLAIALLAISPWMGAFFGEEGLGGCLRILSITFFLLPIGATVNAMLVREMQFGLRYLISLFQVVAQNGMTIALACLGFGYYSMAWGAVTGSVVSVIGCFIWAGRYRIRGVGLRHWREVSAFGFKKTTETVMNQLGGAAPDFVIGRMLGLAQVGLFSRGYGLPRMFRQNIVGAIGAVSYSAYARCHREGGDATRLYLHKITLVTGLGWPCLGFAALFAYPIMMIFFGAQWVASVPILRFMAVFVAVSITVVQYQTLLTAVGRAGAASLATLIRQSLLVAALVIGATISLQAVALAYLVSGCLLTAGTIVFINRLLELAPGAYLRATGHSAMMSAYALIPAAIARVFVPPSAEQIWLPVLVGFVCWLVGYLIGLRVTQHPLWQELKPVWDKSLARFRTRVVGSS